MGTPQWDKTHWGCISLGLLPRVVNADGTRLPGSHVHDMLDYFMTGENYQQSTPQGLDKLIRILFQNGFDLQNAVTRRLRVF